MREGIPQTGWEIRRPAIYAGEQAPSFVSHALHTRGPCSSYTQSRVELLCTAQLHSGNTWSWYGYRNEITVYCFSGSRLVCPAADAMCLTREKARLCSSSVRHCWRGKAICSHFAQRHCRHVQPLRMQPADPAQIELLAGGRSTATCSVYKTLHQVRGQQGNARLGVVQSIFVAWKSEQVCS